MTLRQIEREQKKNYTHTHSLPLLLRRKNSRTNDDNRKIFFLYLQINYLGIIRYLLNIII